MPLQNRVNPFGEVVALHGRGSMMGNRGVLHDDGRRVVRQFAVKRWIACVLEFRGRYRKVMTPHRYTELFFLDEAAALSAGHRPCAECRRTDYNRFREFWRQAVGGPDDADSMDAVLHRERLDNRRRKRTFSDEITALPDGTYVVVDGAPHLIWERALYQWSDGGYLTKRPLNRGKTVEVLTPASIVKVLRAGYRPLVHPSLG
jgi:hypothetical protein